MINYCSTQKKAIATFALVVLFTISGCKSNKIALVDSSGALKSKSQEEVVEDILTHELSYKTITTKGKVSLIGKEFTAHFKLVKDEIIQASVRAPILPIEVMRVDITPKKAVFIDRLGSRYAEVRLDDPEFGDLSAFNFYNLQALLTNQLFLAGNKKVSKSNVKDYNITTSKDHFILKAQDKGDIKYSFSVDASDRIISTLISSASKEMSLLWAYNQFVSDKESIYPTEMSADIKIKKRKFKIGITYSNLDIDTKINVDQSISSKYKQVGIRELIDAYMKFK